ncbi:hypothetical protein DAEQUDRAFT_459879 [Daedalea quercina L-15889]|uniref:Uncharacterized protein n=1 Tax=Daedalea quercina L-15889 TaxID=1314783 RepID=A0A165TCF7_9APHY|nr:hypothetical protein DAEQUDRAFT_459879 [Daedalea quercina L-15889]
MAAPKTNGAQPNGTPPTQPRSTLDADITLLQSLLTQDQNDESDLDVAEILKRLETADGIATGLEGRLDDIMSNLDSMINVLEPEGKIIEQESAIVRQGDTTMQEERVVAVSSTVTEQSQQGKGN